MTELNWFWTELDGTRSSYGVSKDVVPADHCLH